jgi:hypothetical protein
MPGGTKTRFVHTLPRALAALLAKLMREDQWLVANCGEETKQKIRLIARADSGVVEA